MLSSRMLAGNTSAPILMKKMAMNRSRMGSILWLMSLAFLLLATIIPIRNAPMAMDSPA